MILEQSTLIKFFPCLQVKKLQFNKAIKPRKRNKKNYDLIIEPTNDIIIKQTHCLKCNSRLVKNGWNLRILILDNRRGKKIFRLNRKRCPKCGEIKPDLSEFAPRHGIFHDKFKRMARQHYMEGLMPSQIKRVFKIDFNIDISKSSIVNWINEATEPLRMLLERTPVPSSGYWGYDEIHMKIAGKKRYTIDTVDLNTKFVPVARITEGMGRNIGRVVLQEGRKNARLKIKGIVKDCTTNLGGLFRTRSFSNVKQQNCITHVKWIMARHVKMFSGIAARSPKPLPKEWRWLLKRFYDVIDSKNETDIYIKLEILRNIINKLKTKRINRLLKAFKQLEKWAPKIIAHQRDPFLRSTNNLLESFHRKYVYYPSFKKHMMTEQGAQRLLDYRVFGHNLRRFPAYIRSFDAKYQHWKSLLPENRKDNIFRGQVNHYRTMKLKLERWYGKYRQVWDEYFLIS